MIANAFIPAQQVNYEATMKNDCLTFNVNQLLRHHFFVTREQVQTLWRETVHWGQQRVDDRKIKQGVSVAAFKDFFVKDGFVFSVVEVDQFEGEDAYESLKQFVKDNLLENNKYREIVVSCSCFVDGEVLSHAGTFLKQETSNGKISIKYYDPNENHFFEKGDYPINYERLFKRYGLITVLALRGRPVKNTAEETRINNKMGRIMTGNADHVNIEKAKGAAASHQTASRKNLGWGNPK